MADKYEEMARQMRADGVNETMVERFVAEERAEDEFHLGRGTTDIEAENEVFWTSPKGERRPRHDGKRARYRLSPPVVNDR